MKQSKRARAPREPASEKIRERIDSIDEVFAAGGVHLPGVRTVLYLWKRLGLKVLIPVLLIIGFPFGSYSLLLIAANHAIPMLVGKLGVAFEAREWSLNPFAPSAVARDVRIRVVDDPYAVPVMTASEVEFSSSYWDLLMAPVKAFTSGAWRFQPFHTIGVKHGELHIERSLSGHVNWLDVVDRVPPSNLADLQAGLYPVRSILIEDLRVLYVENIAGGSGSGIVKTAQANVVVDGVNGSITGLASRAIGEGEGPTHFLLRGRSADGIVEISGRGSLFAAPGKRPSNVVLISDHATAGPLFEIKVYLENIAAAAFGRMVPATTIVPIRGAIAGTIIITGPAGAPGCDSNARMTDVAFAANPEIVREKREFDLLQRGLAGVASTGPFNACAPFTTPASGGGSVGARTPLLLAALAAQGTASAPPAVRAIAMRDERLFSGQPVPANLGELTRALTGELRQRAGDVVSDRANRLLDQALGTTGDGAGPSASRTSSRQSQNDNALSKGVKGIGHGFKKLFGGRK